MTEKNIGDSLEGFELVRTEPILLKGYPGTSTLSFLDPFQILLESIGDSLIEKPTEIRLVQAHEIEPTKYDIEDQEYYFMFFKRRQNAK